MLTEASDLVFAIRHLETSIKSECSTGLPIATSSSLCFRSLLVSWVAENATYSSIAAFAAVVTVSNTMPCRLSPGSKTGHLQAMVKVYLQARTLAA